ncbi:MAG: hypothetical protein H7246_12345 [Phycisphaerae bacterium]|nr:hypothetical protein [Saprospiraceae bacterium]
MKHFFFLLFNLSFAFLGLASVPSIGSPLGDCDTIITLEGKIYRCHILQQDKEEIQFSLCDDDFGKVYGIRRDQVLNIRTNNTHNLAATNLPTDPNQFIRPRSNILSNDSDYFGPKLRWLKADLVQIVHRGAAFQFESSIWEKGSLVLDFGIRWHSFISPGTEVNEYEETIEYGFFSSKQNYSNQPLFDLGGFAPRRSIHLAVGPRVYLNQVSENSFFIQPSFYLFHHTGLKISDSKTLISSVTYVGENAGWFSFPSTTHNQWRQVRTASKSSRTSLGLSCSLGYRVLHKKGFLVELGTTLGSTFKGANNALQYYGLNDYYIRPFLIAGWKIR